MNDFVSHLFLEVLALGTASGMLVLLNIIIIDVVMSGDNAILIGLATKNLPPKERKVAILWGVILATILRVAFASVAVVLLSILGLKLAGWILLLYVVWKIFRDLRIGTHNEEQEWVSSAQSLRAAIVSIVIADVSMSLDNVLAVAGASHGNIVALGIGLVVSIILMAVASNYMAVLLKKFPQVQWVGLCILLYVALHMILSWGEEVFRAIH